MKDSIFREYDIRGVVDKELFIDQVYDLTQAIAAYFLKHLPNLKTVAVGMDGRTHSPAIKQEICRSLTDSGLDVLFLGICPTPVLYFSLHTQPVQAGLMITASHNTKEYNGIKICLRTESIWGKELQTIKQLYKKKAHISAAGKGALQNFPIITHYIRWLTSHFQHLHGMNLKVIIDCGNGAAGTVLPDLIRAMDWPNVSLLYPEVDGTYPNHEADPTVAANMQEVKKLVTTTDNQFGIGLDGDCDRMAPMTKNGFLVPGDQLLALFAQHVLQQHPGCAIVFDIKSSSGLIELLEKWGAQPIISPSGHSIIKDMMQIHNALLGGELSCHFFFKDRYFGYDDGIYAMLRLFEIVTTSHKTVANLIAIFPKKYSSLELRISCPEEKKIPIIAALKSYLNSLPHAKLLTIDGIRATFPFGWGIIRPSNTQEVLSMRFESNTPEGLKKTMQLFYDALQPHLTSASLHLFTQQMETP